MNIRELLKPKPADSRQQRIEAKLAADPDLLGSEESFVSREEMLFLVQQQSRRIRVSSRPEKVLPFLLIINFIPKFNSAFHSLDLRAPGLH